MKRLTIKNDEQNQYYLFASNDVSREDVYNKLGQLEDIEEELGIDLLTLFKAKSIYRKIEYIDCDEMKSYKVNIDLVYIDLSNNSLKVYENEFDELGSRLEFKDYGKTWALTKEELEE